MGVLRQGKSTSERLTALVLFFCSQFLLTGCGVWSSAPASEEVVVYRLTSHEAACLVAELLAVQFSAVNPDLQKPRAYAMDLGNGTYRILYVRGNKGLFLPEGNGVFERDHFLGPEEEPFLEGPPSSPLGRIWFRHMRAVSPDLGGTESMQIEIESLGTDTCRVRIESRSIVDRQRLDRIEKIGFVLDGAERLRMGLRYYRAGDLENALPIFERLCEIHDEGLSSIHDSLLAQAHALSGLILQKWERGEEARRELALARMRAPVSNELTRAWVTLMEDLGRPGDALRTLQESAARCSPGSREELLLSRLTETNRRETRQAGSYASCLTKAEGLIEQGRYWAAKNWAERARDLRPQGVQAQRVLATSLDGLGRYRKARDLRLLSLHGRVPDATVLLALAENERQLGHPELALRWILRNTKLLDGSELAKQDTKRLIQQIGMEESLRMMRSEGRHEATLPLILAWIRDLPGPRTELFSSILASESLERQRALESSALLGAEPLPMRSLPGASGLEEQRPAELVAPGK